MERMNQSKIQVGEPFTIVDLRTAIVPCHVVGFVRYSNLGQISLNPATVVSAKDEEVFQRVILREDRKRPQTFEMSTSIGVENPDYANVVYSNRHGLYLYVRHMDLDLERLSNILDECRNGSIAPRILPALNGSVRLNRLGT